MELKELLTTLNIAATEGAEKALLSGGQLLMQLSKSEAYRRYGRSNVDRWFSEGLLKNSGKYISRFALEAVAASSNRTTYLPVAER